MCDVEHYKEVVYNWFGLIRGGFVGGGFIGGGFVRGGFIGGRFEYIGRFDELGFDD